MPRTLFQKPRGAAQARFQASTRRLLLCAVFWLAVGDPGLAQQAKERTRTLRYPVAGAADCPVRRGIVYQPSAESELSLSFDLYTPPEFKGERRLPVVVFVNGIGYRDLKGWDQYTSWARATACEGLAAVTYQASSNRAADDLDLLMLYLRQHQSELSIDASNVGWWACSDNVQRALPLAMSATRPYLRCAVFYYGMPEQWPAAIRPDLSLFVVKAGVDDQALNARIDRFAMQAAAANVDMTYVVHASARPAFDVEEDSVRARDIIQDTLKFMRTQLSEELQRESEVAALERRAKLAFFREDWAEILRAYDALTKLKPDYGEAHYRLGYARSFLGQYDEALSSFERAAELNYMRASATYNTACCHSRRGDLDHSLAALRQALELGYENQALIKKDPDLANLRGDPRFDELMKEWLEKRKNGGQAAVKRGSNSHAVFASKIGAIAVAWNSNGLVGVQLPEATPAKTALRLASRAASTRAAAPPWVKNAVQGMRAMLAGEPARFDDLPLDDGHLPEFHSRVYAALRRIPQGATCTYGELAKAAGSPAAARAVGQAMRKNPWPLVVPCHRVLAAGNRMGGFSAGGGVELKALLLRAEAGQAQPARREPAKPKPVRTIAAKAKTSRPKSFDPKLALQSLREQDPRLAPLIDRVPYSLDRSRLGSTFEALLRTIVYQQLNGKAAATIHGRVLDLLPDRRSEPAALLAIDPPLLRKAGLSHSKIAAVLDLARRTQAGELPNLGELAHMADEEIVERLTVVRGIGRWSVEMLLMFWLARPDVLPVGDFGVRHGFMHLMRKQEMPTPEELERYAERWRPYRSVASWYMWRVVDEVRATKLEAAAAAKPSARPAKKVRAR